MSATAEAGADSAAVLLNNRLRRERKRDLGTRVTMIEKSITASRNIIDLSRYRERAAAASAPAISARVCRHCGAALLDGEREEECSSVFNFDELRLRWQAAQILRGLT
jgi:hypothetical protein